MGSIPKIIGVVSCGVVLCLSLSNITQARHRTEPAPCAERKGGQVLHIKGARILVKQSDGEEVICHIDLSTQMSGHIGPGSRIEAKVNEIEGEKYALSISLAQ